MPENGHMTRAGQSLSEFRAMPEDPEDGDQVAPTGSSMRTTLPTGMVTFLMSDVEGSTRLWETGEVSTAAAITRHYELMHSIIARHHGVLPLEQGEGDSVVGAFEKPSEGLEAAREILEAMADEPWPTDPPLRVRLALHTGETNLRDSANYYGRTIIRCARLRAIAHGGQALVSDMTHDLVTDHLRPDVSLRPLGIHQLKDLGSPERVWQLCHPRLQIDFPELRSLSAVPNNLPVQVSSFVGRSLELASISEAIRHSRLVSCVGSGGCGKTRLALQVGAEIVDEHPGGTWWVDLSPVSDPVLVGEGLASAMGIRPEHDRPLVETLAEQLSGAETLVIMDNCEQVVEAVAHLVDDLLRRTPNLRVLTTSREPLGVAGEVVWRVPSLDEETATELFVERAGQVRPGYKKNAEENEVLLDICRRLDGVPLAIELAAARMRMMPAARIAAALDDRFRLLTGGDRTAMARQRTLEASIDWSHELLEEPERILLRRLSVFANGFTLEAAELVCSDSDLDAYAILELVTRLVDKSLVQAMSGQRNPRFRLLDTIRHYAGNRLVDSGDAGPTRERHFEYFLGLAERAAPEIVGADGPVWLADLELEHENIRMALEWIDGRQQPEHFYRLVTALALFWELRGYLESGGRWFERALRPEDEPSVHRARALWGAAHVALYGDDHETAGRRAPEALEMAEALDDKWAIARSLNTISYVLMWFDGPSALTSLERSIELGRAIGDEWAIADGLKMVTSAQMAHNALEELTVTVTELEEVSTRLHNKFFTAWCHFVHGVIARRHGELDLARRELERSIDLCREVGDPATGGVAMAFLGELDVRTGNPDAGRARFYDILGRADGSGALGGAFAAAFLTEMLIGRGEFPEAALFVDRLVGAASLPLFRAWAYCLQGWLRSSTGDHEGADAALQVAQEAAVQAADPWVAVQVADGLGRHAQLIGDLVHSESWHHQALSLAYSGGLRLDVVTSLEALGAIAAERESYVEAVRLFGAADALARAMGFVRGPDRESERADHLELARERLETDVFEEALAEGSALTMDEAVGYASRARGERKRPSYGWDGLTPTEVRVAELVGEGLTNPQIAERMFIARGTVKVHVGHIFTKLTVRTRSELAAEVARRVALVPPKNLGTDPHDMQIGSTSRLT